MRVPIIAGNWKMNKTVPEAVDACRSLERAVRDSQVEVVVCPPFTALSAVHALGLEKIQLGAQNMCEEADGAFTGEISIRMLKDVGCHYVILGHSERRSLYGETDAMVNAKARMALDNGLKPIVCVGETLSERKAGDTERVVLGQISEVFAKISVDKVDDIVVAYEPVWAIGTGETASAEDANAVICKIREALVQLYGENTGQQVRIQYGGSVKPENARELMEQSDIDGALVGGASLSPQDFAHIVNY